MNPLPGQLIQIRFNSGIFFDAIVVSWTDQKSSLLLPETNETVIVQKTLQDVLLVKILNTKASSPVVSEEEFKTPDIMDEKAYDIQKEFEALKRETPNQRNLKKMAELKDELNKLERQDFAKKASSLQLSGARPVSYGLPRNLSIPSPPQYPDQEAPSPNPDFGASLSGLFGKED